MDLVYVKHGSITENKNYKKTGAKHHKTAEVLRAYNKERTLREFNTLTASEAKQISDSSALYVCIKRLRSKDPKAKIYPKIAK